jgi:hypothetical protein
MIYDHLGYYPYFIFYNNAMIYDHQAGIDFTLN